MATEKKHATDYAWMVKLAEREDGGMKGFDTEELAKADAADRNSRARQMNLSAEYVVVKNS